MSEMVERLLDIMLARGLMADEADARALIEEMREPTVEMCDAATRATSAFLALEQRGVDLRRLKHAIRWRAMIDRALADE